MLVAVNGAGLEPTTLGRAVTLLVGRAAVAVDSPSHAFRRTVATLMYEQGVRTRVIERVMGWTPRQMHERHYLRIADQPMREAIRGLYRDDPISDRPRQATPSSTSAGPGGWLADETARLERLDKPFDSRVGLRD